MNQEIIYSAIYAAIDGASLFLLVLSVILLCAFFGYMILDIIFTMVERIKKKGEDVNV